jgi:cold shock protein
MLMGDSKFPADFSSDLVGSKAGDAEAKGLDVFETAGTIKWFDASKGYGFIVPDNGLTDVLLHVTCLRAGGYQVAYEGARVHCEVLHGREHGDPSFSTAAAHARRRAA